MNTLEQWEAYSNLTHYRDQMEQDKPELNRRILALIELIEKKDEALKLEKKFIAKLRKWNDGDEESDWADEWYLAEEAMLKALALNEELK